MLFVKLFVAGWHCNIVVAAIDGICVSIGYDNTEFGLSKFKALIGGIFPGRHCTYAAGAFVRANIESDWAGGHCNIVFAANVGFKVSVGCEYTELKIGILEVFCADEF